MYTDEQLLKLEAEEFLYSNSKLYRYIYNQALEDFVNKCDEAKYIMFKQYTVDMRDIREIKRELTR